jgi:hypothetical protein
MVASGRMARGEVQSMMGLAIQTLGVRTFVSALSGMCDAVLWDTRVWMAQRGVWPNPSERFAMDLGLREEVSDPVLGEFVAAVVDAEIPILIGGHGVVSGGVLAMLEAVFRQ